MDLRKLYYSLPPSLRFLARRIYYLPVDFYETITNKRHKYEPPKGEIYIGSGDFINQGKHHLNLLKAYTGLKKTDSVLDVGSGIGRTAIALTEYLDTTAVYEGFDVVKKGVDWCNKKIKKDYPNFNFTYIPLHNDLYNTSKDKASNYAFPFNSDSFNVVYLFSVFTHMKIAEIENYISEIDRVLKPGGKCLATFFLYDRENESQTTENVEFSFPFKKEGYRLMSEKVESANIAVEMKTLNKIMATNGLEIEDVVQGTWRDKSLSFDEVSRSFQDIVILEKTIL